MKDFEYVESDESVNVYWEDLEDADKQTTTTACISDYKQNKDLYNRLKEFPNLSEIWVGNRCYQKDYVTLDNLIGITNFRRLTLRRYNETVMRQLVHFQNIEEIHLYLDFDQSPSKLAHLEKLNNLKSVKLDIDIYDCLRKCARSFLATVFNILSRCKNLTTLIINGYFGVINIDDLKKCQNISLLNIQLDIVSHDSFKGLKNLKKLKLRKCSQSDISELGDLTSLTHLVLPNSYNGSIKFLQNMKNLEAIEFGDDFDQPIDVLRELKKLKCIIFGSDFNQSLAPIQDLDLKHLLIGYHYGKGFFHVKNMKCLQNLTLRCKIPDYVRFNLPDLRELTLTRTPDIRVLCSFGNSKKLENLTIFKYDGDYDEYYSHNYKNNGNDIVEDLKLIADKKINVQEFLVKIQNIRYFSSAGDLIYIPMDENVLMDYY